MSTEVTRLHALYVSRQLSPLQVVEEHLARAKASSRVRPGCEDRGICARARATAERSQARYAKGRARSVWDGVPVTVEDRLSPRPGEEAPTVGRLEAQGALVVAQTWGAGAVRDGDDGEVAGMTGAPAAATAGVGFASLVVDTGGSARGPASWLGAVAFQPTRDTLPADGVAALAPTLDQVGIVTRGVEDARLAFEALMRPRRRSDRSARDPLRLGVVPPPDDASSDVTERCAEFYDRLARGGVELVEVDPLPWAAANAAVLTILLSESLEGQRDRLGLHWREYDDRLRLSMLAGAAIRGADYVRARAVRTSLRAAFAAKMRSAGIDLAVMPTTPYGVISAGGWGLDDLSRFFWFTGAPSLMGLPAVSVPIARDGNGMAVGVQVVGLEGDDHRVLDAAARIETVRGAWVGDPRTPPSARERGGPRT